MRIMRRRSVRRFRGRRSMRRKFGARRMVRRGFRIGNRM
ncbi:hypothetical protein [Microviridae sp.]|nr:hypothetical protein [Microviridae sp.]